MKKPFNSKARRRTKPVGAEQSQPEVETASGTDRAVSAYLLHKPYGVLSQFTDSESRPTLASCLNLPSMYPVGRLDMDSEGLLILAPKGPIHVALTTPGGCRKTYWAQVEGEISPAAIASLEAGVTIAGQYRTRPAKARQIADPNWPERSVPIRFRKSIPTSWLELTIEEGKNRQVRQMTAAVGFPTLRLIRVAVGPIRLGDLPVGEHRSLKASELEWLAKSVRS